MDLMTTLYLIVVLVMLAAILIGWELSGRWAYLTSRGLRHLHAADTPDWDDDFPDAGSASLGRMAHLNRRLKEAGLRLTPVEYVAISVGLGIGGSLLAWALFVPGLPALAAGGILAYLPFAYLQDRASRRGRQIDEQLAIALSRIAPGLQTGHSLDQVLEEVAHSLQAEGSNPLTSELLRTAQDIRTRQPGEALRDLARRSPSVSLSNIAMLLESYLRAGGGQYAGVIGETAAALQRILAVRSHAQAKATQPLQSARWIPLMLLGVLLAMLNDPLTRASFSEPLVQIALALAMGVMVAGYLVMRRQVMGAV